MQQQYAGGKPGLMVQAVRLRLLQVSILIKRGRPLLGDKPTMRSPAERLDEVQRPRGAAPRWTIEIVTLIRMSPRREPRRHPDS